VAAAANLTGVMDEIARAFEADSHVRVTLSYASTAQLARQIDGGAPFDVFAAADTGHVDNLIKRGKIAGDTRQVYARGQVALWIPKSGDLGAVGMKDLAKPGVRFIAIAQPEAAPYGAAAVEALKAAMLWTEVQPKVVYTTNINQARQQAEAGNADAAFTAYSLVMKDSGRVLQVPEALYRPIEQALGVVAGSAHGAEARQFAGFIIGPKGQEILRRNGYLEPRE
jgi:molybdate transport system substrate-binding protein